VGVSPAVSTVQRQGAKDEENENRRWSWTDIGPGKWWLNRNAGMNVLMMDT
jgi:hypothetical protein